MQDNEPSADVNRPLIEEKVPLRGDVQFWGKLNVEVPQKRLNSDPLIDKDRTSEANADYSASVAILEEQEEYEFGSIEELVLDIVMEEANDEVVEEANGEVVEEANGEVAV